MLQTVDRTSLFEHSTWRTSTKCANGTCVEVAYGLDAVALRDSKDRPGPMLIFSPDEWQAFTDGVRRGEFDLPHSS